MSVRPLVAILGPTAAGKSALALSVAERYGDLLDGYVVDAADAAGVRARLHTAPTLMVTLDDRERLARTVLEFADTLT